MAKLTSCNQFLLATAQAARAILNTGCSLRLFQNNFAPGPGEIPTSFVESTFNGYVRKNLNGLWGSPAKVIDGEFLVSLPEQDWLPIGNAPQRVFGWYVMNGASVHLCGLFGAPINVVNHQQIALVVQLQVWDLVTAINV